MNVEEFYDLYESKTFDKLIDDVEMVLGECEDPEFFSVNCDFEEEHICGYESDNQADFNWMRHQGPTGTLQTGPSFDVCHKFKWLELLSLDSFNNQGHHWNVFRPFHVHQRLIS